MSRENWNSEKRKEVMREKRTALGLKFTRQLTVAEQDDFIDKGIIPVGALSPRTFRNKKEIVSLPAGSKCMICGKDLEGERGFVVELEAPNALFQIICEEDLYRILNNENASVMEENQTTTPPTTPTPMTPTTNPPDPVAAALATLSNALKAPKATVDEGKIISEAVEKAKSEALGLVKDETRNIFAQTVADFLKGSNIKGNNTTESEGEEEEKLRPSARNDGVKESSKASGWAAKATPDAKNAVEKLTAFLSEFSYFRSGVSMRLINTFARAKSEKEKKEVLQNYCEVSQMEDLADLIEKMKSPEFKEVCKAYTGFSPDSVNKRFAVFYGMPGGGKTHSAIRAAKIINGDGDCEVIPCSPSMDSSDVLYAYRLDYKTGKRGYVPTGLLNAMLAGRCVVLDEVNLLPVEVRMFLQNILDNKTSVSVMGVEIPIKEGFFVIGTMNPETALGVTPLPLPLVDRACVVREFKTSAEQAAVGAGLC